MGVTGGSPPPRREPPRDAPRLPRTSGSPPWTLREGADPSGAPEQEVVDSGSFSGAYVPGDVIRCEACDYTFVHRRARGVSGCRRCGAERITRWKP